MSKIDNLYKKIPHIKCQGKCHHTCGLIDMAPIELARINERIGDNLLDKFKNNVKSGCLSCPMLKNEKCSIYDIRPMICRLYGVADGLQCMWGCKPTKLLKRRKARELIQEAAKIPINDNSSQETHKYLVEGNKEPDHE